MTMNENNAAESLTPLSQQANIDRVAGQLARSQTRTRSNWELARRRFMRSKLAVFGAILTFSLIFIAVFAPVVAPYPYDIGNLKETYEFPSREHLFGTDMTGRDYLSRTIYGVRTSLTVALISVTLASLIGLPLGLIAGLKGGWSDFTIQRVVEIMTAFPGILFAIVLTTVVTSGALPEVFTSSFLGVPLNVPFVIGVTSWITLCRLTRALVLQLREAEFVAAARSIGATEAQIGVKHLLPNALAPIVVAITLAIPVAIFTEAGLSFLGLGVNEPVPSLGKMVSDSRQYIQQYWYLGFFPAMAIALSVLGFTFLGDGLRDALDPRQN